MNKDNIKKIVLLIYKLIQSGYLLVPITWGLLVIYISPRFGTLYSPDSFANFLIGKNLFSGNGYTTSAIRDFYSPFSNEFLNSSRSFPPLMPLLIGLVDKLFKTGITSGLYVNLFVLLVLFHVHFFWSKLLVKKFTILIFLSLPFFIFKNDPFIVEIVSGRSIPSTTLCLLCVFYFSSKDIRPIQSIIVGIFIGLLYLSRFDTLLFCILFITYYCVKFEKKFNLYTVLSFILISIPWWIRNIIVFGTPFASDNTITAMSISDWSPTQITYFLSGIPLIYSDPNLWFVQRIDFFLININVVLGNLAPFGGIVVFLIATLTIFFPLDFWKNRFFIPIIFLWILSNLVTVSLTPYHDPRYFSISSFLICLLALIVICNYFIRKYKYALRIELSDNVNNFNYFYLLLICFFTSIILISVNYFTNKRIKSGDIYASYYSNIYFNYKDLVNKNDLVAFNSPEQLAYYTPWKTIYFPVNISNPDANFISYKNKFNIKYAILPVGSNIAKHPLAIINGTNNNLDFVDVSKIGYYEIFSATPNTRHRIGRYDAREKTITSSIGEAGPLVFGPYIKLGAGKYSATFDITVIGKNTDEPLGFVDVSSKLINNQMVKVNSQIIKGSVLHQKIELKFEVDNLNALYEFRVWSNGFGSLQFRNVTVTSIN